VRVVVTASRSWTNAAKVRDRLSRLPSGTTIVHGGAPGGDTIVDAEARALGFTVEVWPADWARYGRGAGVIRNLDMLDSTPGRSIAGTKKAYVMAEIGFDEFERRIDTILDPPPKPDLVVAFWDGESRGTKHTIDSAERRELPVDVIRDPFPKGCL
jgi:hypothetical protein